MAYSSLKRIFPDTKGWIAFAYDIFVAGLAFLFALLLRLGDDFFNFPTQTLIFGTVVFMVVSGCVFLSLRIYRGIWRYASLRDLVALTKAITLAILIFMALMFMLTRLDMFPRSLPFIIWLALMALMGGARFFYRIMKGHGSAWSFFNRDERAGVPILLAGAGDGAELFLRALGRSENNITYQVIGIVSDVSSRVGRFIHGIPVLGTFDRLNEVIVQLSKKGIAPQRLVLTQDGLARETVQEFLNISNANGMTLARIPKLTDFKGGVLDKAEIRPVDVEDLLGRIQKPLDRVLMKNLISDRRILITGAGGSIGSELARQVASLGPCELGLLENSEFNLYSIDMDIAKKAPDLARSPYLADVRDRDRVLSVIRDFKPDLVFHAAALKHVPIVELNPEEGFMTNVIGTVNVADACREVGVFAMVLISTDKAVNPTNVMGATKRIAEQYCQALDLAKDVKTRYVTVRFGNVLGSTGSVIPLFQKQLAVGGPLTVTHPDMTRYFMTVREAVELVLIASAMGSQGHEQEGKIFVLDMGSPVRILDLARQMIRLQGLEPEKDIEITFTGIRPGEKLFEEILHDSESLVYSSQRGLLLAAPRPIDVGVLRPILDRLASLFQKGRQEELLDGIHALVPEYVSPASSDSL